MLRRALLQISRSRTVKAGVTKAPVTREVVRRFVPGETVDQAVAAVAALQADGLLATVDHLGEDTRDPGQADRVMHAYRTLLGRMADEGLARSAEVSVKLTALGQALGPDGPRQARERAQAICVAARNAGTTVTLDMEDHLTTDATLETLRELRHDFPDVGAVLQSYLRRTEADCRDLAYAGSRVRLCKGAYAEPPDVAYADPAEVDRCYVRCTRILMAGQGLPMLATHDPRLIAIAQRLAAEHGRLPDRFEYQMLYGVRPAEQRRLAAAGHKVRVYVPYGQDWYGYLVRRLAERPANLAFFARSLISRG